MEQKDALVRIGRNLANFQTLEHLLKELIPTLRMRGTVAEIQGNLESRKKGLKKSSLGNLSDAFHSSVFEPPLSQETPEEVSEPVFSFTAHIEASPEHARNTKARWRKLVAQRNSLVHTQLMKYDLTKAEDCNQLCGALDSQNLEICAMLDELASFRSHKAIAAAAMVEELKTGKFLEAEPLPQDDA